MIVLPKNSTVRIWKSHRTNFFSQYDEHNQKLSLDLKLEQDLKEKLRFSLSQVLFVTAVFLKNSKLDYKEVKPLNEKRKR